METESENIEGEREMEGKREWGKVRRNRAIFWGGVLLDLGSLIADLAQWPGISRVSPPAQALSWGMSGAFGQGLPGSYLYKHRLLFLSLSLKHSQTEFEIGFVEQCGLRGIELFDFLR